MLDEIIAEVRRAAEENLSNLFSATEKTAAFAVERLRQAPPDLLVPFVVESLRIARDEIGTIEGSAFGAAAGMILRRKRTFTEEQATRLVEYSSVLSSSFPYRGILKAAESVPMSPRLAGALRKLRPCITEYLGGPEMKALHERIDALLARAEGRPAAPALGPQGAWSEAVLREVQASPEWLRVFGHILPIPTFLASYRWLVDVGRDRLALHDGPNS